MSKHWILTNEFCVFLLSILSLFVVFEEGGETHSHMASGQHILKQRAIQSTVVRCTTICTYNVMQYNIKCNAILFGAM